jgi:hypothetical protein
MLFSILRESGERNSLIEGMEGRHSGGVKVRQKNIRRALLNKVVIQECTFDSYS